jgi:hypothetical protein
MEKIDLLLSISIYTEHEISPTAVRILHNHRTP